MADQADQSDPGWTNVHGYNDPCVTRTRQTASSQRNAFRARFDDGGMATGIAGTCVGMFGLRGPSRRAADRNQRN
jgi:hypothetical protein